MHITKFPIISNRIQPTELIGEIVRIAAMLENPVVMVDAGGMGLFVFKKLEELGQPGLKKVLWGAPCWRRAYKEAYFNMRSQAMVCMAKAVTHGHLSIDAGAFPSSREKSEFLDQSRIPYHFTDLAQYRIESKGSKEWEGLPSPDIIDSVSFGFLEACQFTPVEGSDSEMTGGAVMSAVEAMRAKLAAKAAARANEQKALRHT